MCKNMLNFLKQSRSFLNTQVSPTIHDQIISNKIFKDIGCIIIGNESCDLDSAVCAISLAYLYNKNCQTINGKLTQNFLPVLNIPRADYALKTEVKYVFGQLDISADCLTFRDDISEELINLAPFILVDHHVSPFASRCQQVFDHRPLDSAANLPKDCQLHLETVGSCATLIGDEFIKTNSIGPEFTQALSILRQTIILDTVNFSAAAARATPKDQAVCEKIEKLIKSDIETRQVLFDALVKARSDVSQLSAAELLRKDLKILANKNGKIKVALPGFPLSVKEFMQRPNVWQALEEFAQLHELSAILLMGLMVTDDVVERDLGLIELDNTELCAAIHKELKNAPLDLNLERWNCISIENGYFYKQKNIKITRKHILPIIKNIIDTI